MPRVSPNIGPTDKYDAFLSASVAEQENGTPVSVLSALTRANRDPWQEASRLAELPSDRAQRALVEIFNEVLERPRSLAECENLARHLVRLLPGAAAFVAPRPQAAKLLNDTRLVVFWAFWVAIFLLVSLSQNRQHMRHTNTGESKGARVQQLRQDAGMNFGGQGAGPNLLRRHTPDTE